MTRSGAFRGAILGSCALVLSGVIATAGAQTQPPAGGVFPGFPEGVRVDKSSGGGRSNLNGVLEPGETVLVEPSYANPNISRAPVGRSWTG